MELEQEAIRRAHGRSLLLVEGVDDKHAFFHIFMRATGREPAFAIDSCDSDSGVLERLGSIVVGVESELAVIGAVLDADADTGVVRRRQSIRRLLEPAYDFPETFPVDGLIVKPKRSRMDRDRLPTIGVWFMPDNVRDGIFEDLLRAAMTPEVDRYVSAVVDKAKSDGIATFRSVERSKAIVKTHIAWQDPRKKDLGVAIRDRHFENLVPACEPFLNWLEALFGQWTA